MARSQRRKKKSVRIADEKENYGEDNGEPAFGFRDKKRWSRATEEEPERDRSRSKRKEEKVQYDSPRRQLYEAKFEKYLADKEQRVKQDKKLESMKKEDFERYMRGPESPAKSAQRFGNRFAPPKSFRQMADEGATLYKAAA